MFKYTVQRVIAIFIILFITVSLSFIVLRSMPGSVFHDPSLDPEIQRMMEDKYHLNDPILVQYGYFLKDALRGDFGTSFKLQPKVPVFDVIKSKIPISLQLNIFSLLFTVPVGMIFGIWAALKKNTFVDTVISTVVVLFISVPAFVFAALMQYFLAFKFGWFPILMTAEKTLTFTKFYSMILPILALSFGGIATITRYVRAELADSISSEYMLLAKTKGLTQLQATIKHALRNSFIPLVNVILPMFLGILGGSLVIENIFGIPGVGQVMVGSIGARDFTLTIGTLIFYSLIGLTGVLLMDLTYGIVDPRIRMGGGKQ